MFVSSEYPFPPIDSLMQSVIELHYVTGLDLNMGYLYMPLDEPSKVILTIIMPFLIFECQVLHQGVNPATDIFQDHMTLLFSHSRSNAPNIYSVDVLQTTDNSFDGNILLFFYLRNLSTSFYFYFLFFISIFQISK